MNLQLTDEELKAIYNKPTPWQDDDGTDERRLFWNAVWQRGLAEKYQHYYLLERGTLKASCSECNANDRDWFLAVCERLGIKPLREER